MIDKELRKTGIGGSDVAAVLGLSQWDTPLDIYMQKKGFAADKEVTPRMEMGNLLEEWIFDNYCKLYNKTSGKIFDDISNTFLDIKVDLIFSPGFKRHAEHEFMIANVDAIDSVNKKIIEIKYSKFGDGFGEDGTDDIPLQYRCQVMHYMSVWGYDSADIFVYIDSKEEFRLFHVERDKELEELLIVKEKHFWEECVLKGVEPPPMSLEDVKLIYKKSEPKSIEATADIKESIKNIKILRDKIAELTHKKKELQKVVCEFMGDHEAVIDESGVLATWKSGKLTRGFLVK